VLAIKTTVAVTDTQRQLAATLASAQAASDGLRQTEQRLDMAVDQLPPLVASLNHVAGTLDRQIAATQPVLGAAQGALTSIQWDFDAVTPAAKKSNELVYDARLAVDNANSAALDERFYFETQVPAMLGNVNTALVSLNSTITGMQPVEWQLQTASAAFAATSKDVYTAVHHATRPRWWKWWLR